MFVTAEAAGSRSIESIKKGPRLRHGPFLIDATGFEPATSASRRITTFPFFIQTIVKQAYLHPSPCEITPKKSG
jgi:hypothetical protein